MQTVILKIDCTEEDISDVVDLLCRQEKRTITFRKAIKGRFLIAYRCDTCRWAIHPIDLVLAGVIIEGRLSKKFYI